ncbi:hypothetical protein QPK87_33830 [Kamptonema cortianum]|nr:hypothetical protein [Kamptonema cortianum]
MPRSPAARHLPDRISTSIIERRFEAGVGQQIGTLGGDQRAPEQHTQAQYNGNAHEGERDSCHGRVSQSEFFTK